MWVENIDLLLWALWPAESHLLWMDMGAVLNIFFPLTVRLFSRPRCIEAVFNEDFNK